MQRFVCGVFCGDTSGIAVGDVSKIICAGVCRYPPRIFAIPAVGDSSKEPQSSRRCAEDRRDAQSSRRCAEDRRDARRIAEDRRDARRIAEDR